MLVPGPDHADLSIILDYVFTLAFGHSFMISYSRYSVYKQDVCTAVSTRDE